MDALNGSSDTVSKTASTINEYSISELIWTCGFSHFSNDASAFKPEPILIFWEETTCCGNVLPYISKKQKVNQGESTRPYN